VGDTECRIADIWSSLLGHSQVNADADFFDIGGNSLLAARLLSRIEASFGRKVSLASLFKARTVQGLARLVDAETGRDFDFRQVVKLRPNSRELPIVAINNTGMYFDLANRFCLDRPFTALQALRPSRCSSLPAQSIEELAAEYVRLLLGVHSDRACVLMGWCVGGALAYENAQQLRRRNHDVPLLILIDTWVPGYLRRLPRHAALLADCSYRSQLILSSWRAATGRKKRLTAFLAGRNLVKRIFPSFRAAGENGRLGAPDPFSAENCELQLQRYLDAAVRRYDPRPYDGKILLIRSEQQPKPVFLDHGLGWEGFAAGGIQIVTVPGDHFTMFREPGVREIARVITAALANTEASAAMG
jgi:thioesterase domain-containing protein/acyl carrier protein